MEPPTVAASRYGASQAGATRTVPTAAADPRRWADPGLDLYWIPLGAGARVVRASGAIYESLAAAIQRRPRCRLYHSALVVNTDDAPIMVEMTPVPRGGHPETRGVVASGAVGSRWLRRFRVFRYEIRRWTGGIIPDLSAAVSSPVRITEDPEVVRRVLDLLPAVPTPVWGRDELGLGDMWNSNSVIAWALTTAGVGAVAGRPPGRGRAPGWDAGVLAASKQPPRAG